MRRQQIDDNLETYCPHQPWPKQRQFLNLRSEEAFYGGAAGGGKSDVLLMAALRWVHVPQYAALILRRDFRRLSLPGAIMDRSREWLANTDAKWQGTECRWRFPSSATIQFGYIDNPQDRFRYASSEFQLIAYDELSEFRLDDSEANPYLFLFSRLRKTEGNPVPLQVMSASNPGNIGHAWCKRRFISGEALQALRDGRDGVFWTNGRAFVPSKVSDNPAVNADDYRQRLSHLPPVTRERLMKGDWDVAENLVIPEAWLTRYEMRGEIIRPLGDRGNPIDCRQLQRFATIDTAGTSKDRAKATRGIASWSVIGIWDYHASTDMLYLRAVKRGQWSWSDLVRNARDFLSEWRPRDTNIENAQTGPALAEELRKANAGGNIRLVGPTIAGMADTNEGAKLDRAIASGLLKRLESGRLSIPCDSQAPQWLPPYIGELTAWSGAPEETCDQIDMSSYAAHRCKHAGQSWGGVIR